MKVTLKNYLQGILCLFFIVPTMAQTCHVPIHKTTRDLGRSETLILSYTAANNASEDRLVFRVKADIFTKSVATLNIYVDGVLSKTQAIRKGAFRTTFALRGLSGKLIEVKGMRASRVDRRRVEVTINKASNHLLLNNLGYLNEGNLSFNIPRGDRRVFVGYPSCTGRQRFSVSITNSNNAPAIIRVREGGTVRTFRINGSTRNITAIVASQERLIYEIENTNQSMGMRVSVSVRASNQSASLNVGN